MTTTDPTGGAPADPTTISYAEAAAELDRILAALDGDHVDVDVLAVHVERAAVLITVCRDRISAARIHVERAVAGLSTASGPAEHHDDHDDHGEDEDQDDRDGDGDGDRDDEDEDADDDADHGEDADADEG